MLSHHEHIDGSGLPNGLVGDEIPLFSKIIAVANIYAGLTAKNMYYEYLSKQEAIIELNHLKNNHLDTNIVNIFIDKVLN
ncbi:putative cyclic di-GMP phosphodiesterase [bioreactor metagenome]|uniref:Putative cyclic di-GMP phosphodiesterase n=1 Tax=bioreactor metagenome TaxID=1076179 RepID=A0A645GPR9_9ZZZZ